MRNLIVSLMLTSGNFALADCPNLSGSYVGKLNQDVIKIVQNECSSLEIGYASDSSSVVNFRTYTPDKIIRYVENGKFQKSYWTGDFFTTQLFKDLDGKKPASPKQIYSLYSTEAGAWLKVATYHPHLTRLLYIFKHLTSVYDNSINDLKLVS